MEPVSQTAKFDTSQTQKGDIFEGSQSGILELEEDSGGIKDRLSQLLNSGSLQGSRLNKKERVEFPSLNSGYESERETDVSFKPVNI